MNYHYGQIIRMYRQQRGIAQSELAKLWPKADGTKGVNIRYLQDIEYGKKQISDPAVLRKLATLLDIPLWSFGLSEYDPFCPAAWPNLKIFDELASTTTNPYREPAKDYAQRIPTAYYERMLRAYTQIEPLLFAWTMWNLGLLQLSSQIGYTQQAAGSIAVFKCSPPCPRVRSLYEIARHNLHLPQTTKLRFYGQESLAGQTVQEGKTILNANSCATPILRRNCIGACLIVYSQSHIDPSDVEIIQRYADLFSLAFSDSEFYLPQNIDLCTIPAEIRQDILLQEFDLQRLDLASLNITEPDRIPHAEELILQRILAEKRGGVDVSAR